MSATNQVADDAASTEAKELQTSLTSLQSRRRNLRRSLQQYERLRKRFTSQITRLTSEDESKEKPEEKNKLLVIAAYRLLRNFSISFNQLTISDKEVDKQVVPPKFKKDIAAIFKNHFEVIQKALVADNVEESYKMLPKEVSLEMVEDLTAYIEKHENTEILYQMDA